MFSYTETKDSLLLTAPSMNVEAGSFIQLRFRPKKGTITKVVNNGTEYFIKPNDVSPKFDGQTIVYKDSLESEVYIERSIYTFNGSLDKDESLVKVKINPVTGGSDFQGNNSTLKLPAGVTDLTSGVGGGSAYNLKARHIEEFGSAVGGFWDEAFSAAMTAAYLCGGIHLMLTNEQTYALSGTFPTIPNNGDTAPQAVPIILQGAGCHWSGRGKPVLGSTVLDIRGVSAYGKITLTSLGLFGLRDLTLTDSTASGGALIYTTNATLDIQGCAFVGITAGTLATQDAIILGGPNQVEGGSGVTDGFQGYGTIIQRNFFHKIRRVVYGRAFCNAVSIRGNTVWTTCGASDNTPCIEIDGAPAGGAQVAAGCSIVDNLLEVPNYAYGIALDHAQRNYLRNTFYDSTAKTVAAYKLGAGAVYNRIDETYTSCELLADSSSGNTNVVSRISQGTYSYHGPTDFTDTSYATKAYKIAAYGGSDAVLVQPAAAKADGVALLRVSRSAAEGTNPSQDNFKVMNGGEIRLAGAWFQVNGNKWISQGNAGAGQNMTWDSGPGGSYNDIRGYAIRHYDHTGALCATLTSAATGWVIAKPITWKPAASQTPVNNGDLTFEATSNTSLTVKLKGSDGTVRSVVLTLA